MGYANTDQTARGLHTRLFSRAFIVDDGNKRVVFVTSDIGMVSQRLRLEVFQALKEKYGDLYRQDNVVLSGTHTHSGVGGYFQYTLFMITSKGYIKPSIQAIVSGIVKSIDIAHRNLRPGRIFINKGQVADSNFNRSPHSYMNNPEEERNRYEFNTDKQIVVLKFTDLDGDGIGLLSWFAVHPVSMNYTNRMVSSDNLGYASYIFEQEKNIGFLPGEKGPFVAGFSSSNLGDSSPNIRGPVCVNTGLKCDYINSSCPVGGELEVKEPFTNAEVVVAGLCNIYTHYITTYEEYQIQRYEGASTIFGPHTLSAYIQRYRGLAKAIAHGTIGELPKGPEPPFFDEDKLFNQVRDPVADVAPVGTTFGDVLQEVNPVYKVGEIASVTFVSGNPRHSGDIRDTTLVTVERFHNDTGSWEIIHNDASWETRFHWIKGLAGRSQAKVEWHIPQTAKLKVPPPDQIG